MKYKKKPVVIEAFEYDGDLQKSNGEYYVPDWAVEAYENGVLYYKELSENEPIGSLFIKTLEGDMLVGFGDYVIQGIQGEIYPCKPDIFKKTYEDVGDEINENTSPMEDKAPTNKSMVNGIVGNYLQIYDIITDKRFSDLFVTIDYSLADLLWVTQNKNLSKMEHDIFKDVKESYDNFVKTVESILEPEVAQMGIEKWLERDKTQYIEDKVEKELEELQNETKRTYN